MVKVKWRAAPAVPLFLTLPTASQSHPLIGESYAALHQKRVQTLFVLFWWEGVDSNHRSRRRQIYSLMHLATLQPARINFICPVHFAVDGYIGAGDWNRTHNLLITNQLLCQLSYASAKAIGALGWNRTADIWIFSPALYQLSYQGALFLKIFIAKYCAALA